MKIVILGPGGDSFADALNEAGIEYELRKWHPQPGEIMNATGDWLDLAGNAGIFAAVATVAVQWLKARASRKVIITTSDHRTIHADGYSPEDLAKILESAKELKAIDREKPDQKA